MAVNVFLKMNAPDVTGSSLMKGHEGWEEVITWSHSWHQPANPVRSASGGATMERAHHGEFTYSKEFDESDIPHLKLLWSGKHIEKITMICYRSAGDTGAQQMAVPYLKVEMEACVLSNISASGGPGELPHWTLSINYAKVTYTYTPTEQSKGTAAGAVPVSHDLRTNVVA